LLRGERRRDKHGDGYRSFSQNSEKCLKMGVGNLDSIKTETEDLGSVSGNYTD